MTEERETDREEVAALLRGISVVEDVEFVDHGGDIVALVLHTSQYNDDKFTLRVAVRADELVFEVTAAPDRRRCRPNCTHSRIEHSVGVMNRKARKR